MNEENLKNESNSQNELLTSNNGVINNELQTETNPTINPSQSSFESNLNQVENNIPNVSSNNQQTYNSSFANETTNINNNIGNFSEQTLIEGQIPFVGVGMPIQPETSNISNNPDIGVSNFNIDSNNSSNDAIPPVQMPVPASLDNIVTQQQSVINPDVSIQPNIANNINNSVPNLPEKRNHKKLLLIIGIVLVLLIIVILVYFLVIKNDNNKTKSDPDKDNNNGIKDNISGGGNKWDPTKSIIVEVNDADAIKLKCKKSDESEFGTDASNIIYTFKDNIFIQAIIEDEMLFSKDTIKYYEYYASAADEELNDNKDKYDNVVAEVRKKDMSVSYVYSVDMTADKENPKNLLNSTEMTYDSAKLELEKEGYVCE